MRQDADCLFDGKFKMERNVRWLIVLGATDTRSIHFVCLSQYPMDRAKGIKVPVQIRVNMWLGLSAHEKKFNSFSEGTFSVFAELVH